MKRRHFILAAGACTVGLVGAGATWSVSRVPTAALAPWQIRPGLLKDVRLDALRYAILAPNPHNRQPWIMKLVGTDIVNLYCDLSKRLPETDPFDRQTTIGFGTFIELARIAGAERGVVVTMDPFPEGVPLSRFDERPIARLHFATSNTVARDPLFAQILLRRSNKEKYDDMRLPSADQITKIAGGGHATTEPAVVAAARVQILESLKIESGILRTHMESVRLLRVGDKEIEANPDGIALYGSKIGIARLLGLLDRKKLADPQSTASKTALGQQRDTYGSLPALYWVKTPGNTRLDQLEAGRQYVRANLEATALGMAMHPTSQSLQEYGEMSKPFENIHRILGAAGDERIQMLARVGFGPTVPPSPRWPLERHLG